MPYSLLTALSLFTSGGIGDLAVRQAGFDILVSNELLEDRHAVFSFNFSATHPITGDIWKKIDAIETATREQLNKQDLTLLYATPPCQGMSKNGRGKLLSAIRAGGKSGLDARNRLVVPAMELASRLRPDIILLENVPEMENTVILDKHKTPVRIVDFIRREIGPDYVGGAEVVEFANYGVPQCRRRLITVFSRHPRLVEWYAKCRTFLPRPTHTPEAQPGTRRWVTVRDAIGDLPPLDAKNNDSSTSEIPFHRVPILDAMKYWWIENTPAGRSAFDNQCVSCKFDENPTHISRRDPSGVNRPSRATPLYCRRCGEMLPRPSVERNGVRELMRGYTSVYKRMPYDKPASALTRNLSYACSDNKLHPEQNRVLSLYEAFRIHSLDHYSYQWERLDKKRVSNKTIREIIGESIPPFGLQRIINHLTDIYKGSEAVIADSRTPTTKGATSAFNTELPFPSRPHH